MKKKILIFILIFAFYRTNVNAKCSYAEISRMKSLANNINVSYDYKIDGNFAKFDLTLTNITQDIYIYDSFQDKNYYYDDTINGEITINDYSVKAGSYKFYSANPNCYGLALGTKYYNLPTYNIYYNDLLCSDIKNFSLCQKWINNNYNYDKFKQMVYEYKDSMKEIEEEEIIVEYEKTILNKVVDFYVKYYHFILVFIILVCSIIIVIDRKKNSFKL